jgi:hypothetical protein
VGPGEVGNGLVEQHPQRRGVLLQLILSRADARELKSERAVLGLVPARADPALDATVRDVVDRRHRFREQPGTAERDAEHEATDAHTCGLRRRSGQRRDGLEAVTVAVAVRRLLEVIRDREPSETPLIREPPQPLQLVERTAQMADMDAEIDAPRLIPVFGIGARTTRCRRLGGRRRRGALRGAPTAGSGGGTRDAAHEQRRGQP